MISSRLSDFLPEIPDHTTKREIPAYKVKDGRDDLTHELQRRTKISTKTMELCRRASQIRVGIPFFFRMTQCIYEYLLR